MRLIKHQAEEATLRLSAKSKQKEEHEVAAYSEKVEVVTSEIAALQRSLEEEIAKNREEEAQARKKKFKIESEVENWISKYDADLEEKQAEIDDISVYPSCKCVNARAARLRGREGQSGRAEGSLRRFAKGTK